MASGSERAAAFLQDKGDGPSMMEQMLAEASAARKAETERKESAKRAKAKNSFGSGLRGGFLSQSQPKKTKASGKPRHRARRTGPASGATSSSTAASAQGIPARGEAEGAEVRSHSVRIAASWSAFCGAGPGIDPGRLAQEPASVTGKAGASGKGMVFDEVQEAMKAADGGAAERLLADGCAWGSTCGGPLPALTREAHAPAWANGELFEKIMANPKLRKGAQRLAAARRARTTQ